MTDHEKNPPEAIEAANGRRELARKFLEARGLTLPAEQMAPTRFVFDGHELRHAPRRRTFGVLQTALGAVGVLLLAARREHAQRGNP